MKKVRWPILTFLFVSVVALASSKAEQEAALNEILKGLNNDTEDSVIASYGAKYTVLVSEQLGELADYKGLDCRAKVSLSSTGRVEHVEIDNQNRLCRKVFNTVWDMGSFPLPNDVVEANKLRLFSFAIAP
ncbi:hypothetical protein JL456_21920 [Vibrio neptunius]|uniref:TonB C-terminal domain-containing protein n=1 Tax=Vibrio neptunius TaxID=170651 RepID=A0ABS3A758_9VIBR|nr:hypothetical protein [Vibrio neptunius]MBN3517505.1 hypothetical protein [Vibrio neptunius]MBN3551842.1 hypothetical protein [Vibrio neptunius]MBN3580307.1 hypothetical protein [Vibrio neptunius]MCH9873973.1 hypothetical protein [Vibrio neptunius]